MIGRLAGITLALAALSLLFGLLERAAPATPGLRFWKRPDAKTDFVYWFFTPLATKGLTHAAVVVAIVGLALLAGVPIDQGHLQAFAENAGRVSRQPLALQALEVLVLSDLIGYWTHRAFHSRRLWPFHAVHHSSTQLDWLSSVRVHPVNDAASKVAQVVGLVVLGRWLGFAPAVVAGAVPFFVLYAILQHANVPWTFGPLRWFLASPAFHRWHHTAEEAGLDKNFAGLFPWIDLAFGTFYLPPRLPMRLGIADFPSGVVAQLLHPFRRG